MKMKNELLNAYFAGLIDGEGTVDVYDYKNAALQRPVIKVDMTCKKTICALKNHFGGYMGIKKVEAKPNRKPCWRWEVTFTKAIEVCKKIRPYLITKADGADRILRFIPRKVGRPAKNTL